MRAPRPVLCFLGLAVLAAALGACSLIVESSDQQCQTDADCARFAGTRCDTSQYVCVARDGGTDGGGCDGAGGGC